MTTDTRLAPAQLPMTKAVSGKQQQWPTTKSAVINGSSLQRWLTAAAYNDVGSGLRRWQTTAVAYIDGSGGLQEEGDNGLHQWQQPTMVAAAAYIDGRRRQWPTPMTAVLIMTWRGGGFARDGGQMRGRGRDKGGSLWHK